MPMASPTAWRRVTLSTTTGGIGERAPLGDGERKGRPLFSSRESALEALLQPGDQQAPVELVNQSEKHAARARHRGDVVRVDG